jgi:hypothetical protein
MGIRRQAMQKNYRRVATGKIQVVSFHRSEFREPAVLFPHD